ncbi:hypothetical protein J9M50_004796 [Salmonella enterica]|nr:hypothetical protein [Salmonella enterica]EHI9911146.1 hypothetical protein [Salmonella enterica]EHJ0910488.1 hypothetical protein [Salmonella enterica]
MGNKIKSSFRFSCNYDSLFYNYHKDKFIILRSAYEQAVEIYESARLNQALLSFSFILKECEASLAALDSDSDLYIKIDSLISDIKESISECEAFMRKFACQ